MQVERKYKGKRRNIAPVRDVSVISTVATRHCRDLERVRQKSALKKNWPNSGSAVLLDTLLSSRKTNHLNHCCVMELN